MTQTPVVSLRGDLRRTVAVAAPLYLSMIAVSLGGLVNTAALGRFGTADLAAFALVSAVHVPANAAVTGAVRGVMPFVSAAADDRATAVRVVRDGTWLAVVLGLLGAAAIVCVGPLARVTGVPEVTVDRLGAYPVLMAVAVLLASVGSMASASLVGLGRSPVVMRVGLVSAVVTVGLSLLLVNGAGPLPAWGLTGSGVAMVVTNAVACLLNLAGLRGALGLTAGSLAGRPQPGRLAELARVGIPMAGTVLIKFGVLGVLAFAAARISAPAAASHGIATSLVGLTFIAAVAVGQAGIPLIGARAGLGDGPGVRSAVRAGLLVAAVVLGLLCVLLVVLQPFYLPLFTGDPAVRAVLARLLPVVALAILADGLQAVAGFGLTGLKRTVPSLLVFAVCYGLLALAAVPVAAAGGVIGLWTALVVVNALVCAGQQVAFLRVAAGLSRRPG